MRENHAYRSRGCALSESPGTDTSRSLSELVASAHTAVVTMELQRGVVGDLATFPELREAVASSSLLESAGAICDAARGAGARVVHATAEFREDLAASARNCRLLAASQRLNGEVLARGAPGAELIPELNAQPSDIVVPRVHGLTPFTATSLDQVLRNCDVKTVVAIGSSLNVGVVGPVLSAVDLGYQVVVPTDAVVGVPAEYGAAVIDNTLAMLATLTSSADLIAAWQANA